MKLFAILAFAMSASAQEEVDQCYDVCDQQHMENLVACNGDADCMLEANNALRECIKECDAPAPTDPPAGEPDEQCLAHCDNQHEHQLAHCKPGDQKCIDKADQHYVHCVNQCSCEGHCVNQHENQLSHCHGPHEQDCIDKADQHFEHCLDNCAAHTAPDTTTTTTEGTTEPVTDEPVTTEETTTERETTAVVDETTVAEFSIYNSDCENRCNTHYRNEANNNCRPSDQACLDKYRRLAAQCVKENC